MQINKKIASCLAGFHKIHALKKTFFVFGLMVLLTTTIFFLEPKNHQVKAATGGVCPANIDYEGDGNYGHYNSSALSNPNVGGVDLSYDWADIEPQQGVFNWVPGDQEMAAWAAQGKKFTIVVRYIAEGSGSCTGPQYLPSWEIARIPHFCSTTGHIMPDYFDPTFTADLKAYVQAIADHIAQSPYKNNLLYIRLGVGIGGESFPYPHPGTVTADKTQLEQYGYTPTKWAAWQQDMMTSYKNSFSFAKVIYPLNGQDIDPTTGQDVSLENGKWAAANGFGLGQQGLTANTNSPLFQQTRTQYPQIYIQYQTVGAVGTGVAANAQAAEKNGAQFVEWYTIDIINPANQTALAQFQQFVNTKYGQTCSVTTGTAPNTGSATPTIFGVTPIFGSIGDCKTNQNCPSTTPGGSGNGSPVPSSANSPLTSPAPSSVQPSSAAPCTAAVSIQAVKRRSKHKNRNKNGTIRRLMQQLLNLIRRLLEIIGHLLHLSPGGSTPGGGTPQPSGTPSPCPSSAPQLPSAPVSAMPSTR